MSHEIQYTCRYRYSRYSWVLSECSISIYSIQPNSIFKYLIIVTQNNRYEWCIALPKAEFFHRTPAGHTAERKTRRKRNAGCYELLSAPCHPSSPPSPSPHRASVAPPAATLSGLAEGRLLPPPFTHVPPIAEFEQFSASSAKSKDGLYLGAWKCCSWIWTAFVIMYEFEVQW